MSYLLSLIIIAFLGLHGSPQPTPDPVDFASGTIEVGEQTFVVPFPSDAEEPVAQPPSVDGCPGIEETVLPRTDAADLVFIMVPADCDIHPEAAGNGNYGYYRTLADVADGTVVDTVVTGIGTATIVDVPYYECTNSCTEGVLRMALIAIDDAADPAYSTLQVFQPVIISNDQVQDLDIAAYVAGITGG